MISDVLADAIDEIKRYQKDFPTSYDEIKFCIHYTVSAMESLGRLLDTTPTDAEVNKTFTVTMRLKCNVCGSTNLVSTIKKYGQRIHLCGKCLKEYKKQLLAGISQLAADTTGVE